jgi:hypothetical protein
MGSLLALMFIGLSTMAGAMHVAPFEKGTPTVISQVGKLVYGGGGFGHALFLSLQVGTMLILVLAANTSFADFPRLANFAAEDSFLPRQLQKRGHRLVFSNGVIALSVAAIALVIATDAKVTRLIPLYAIGVFTSFTLSQTAMAKHHTTHQAEGWKRGLFINATGAVMTGVVAIIIAITKFSEGGWVIIAAVPILVLVLIRLNRQYVTEEAELQRNAPEAAAARILRRHVVVVLVNQLDLAAARAIQYARTLVPDELRCIHFSIDTSKAGELRTAWSELGLSRVPLDVIDCPDRRLTRAAVEMAAEILADDETELTVLLPRIEHTGLWHRLLHDRTADSFARALAPFPHANVTFVPYHLGVRPWTGEPSRRSRASEPSTMPADLTLPEGAIPIGACRHRNRVTVAGRIKAVRVQPRAGVATLQATLADDTGEITIVFLGRRQVGGIEPGAVVLVSGVVGDRRGKPEILNPEYELLSASGAH